MEHKTHTLCNKSFSVLPDVSQHRQSSAELPSRQTFKENRTSHYIETVNYKVVRQAQVLFDTYFHFLLVQTQLKALGGGKSSCLTSCHSSHCTGYYVNDL